MFITGPDVIKTVTGEEVDFESLGGAMTHNAKSGVAHLAADDEDALPRGHALPARLPAAEQPRDAAARSCPPTTRRAWTTELDRVVPDSPNKPYDMRNVVRARGRRRRVLRDPRALRQEHRRRLRAAQRPRGRRRRQPAERTWPACSTSTRSAKAARFVRTCDAFNIPILTLCDVPGFLPGTTRSGAGSSATARSCCTRSPRRRCRRSPSSRARPTAAPTTSWPPSTCCADFNFAWPSAEVAVMGPEGAVNIIYRRDIATSPTPDDAPRRS